MKKLHLEIITPERTLFSEDVLEITLPTKTGEISVLPDHMPLVSEIAPGEIIVKSEKEEKIALVYGGYIYVKEGSQVTVLADSAEHLSELNEKEILEAKKRAEEAKAKAAGDKALMAEAESALARNVTRLNVLKKHERRQHKSRKGITLDQ